MGIVGHGVALGLLVGFVAVGIGGCEGDSGSGGSGSGGSSAGEGGCEEILSEFRSCNLLTEGKVSCDDFGATPCEISCIQDASCDELESWLCLSMVTSSMMDCLEACELAGGTFACADGSDVIAADYQCDGMEDCNDGSDEVGCQGVAPATFTCDDGEQVPADWRCDGEVDCNDSSDEDGCPASSYFTCGSGEQISAAYVCDLDPDCDDESDEAQGCAQLVCD
jgi:hypothetical protein